MPLIQTDSQHYSDIADAIRDMSGNEETFYPSEMAAGVRSIPQTIAIQPIIYSLEEREVGVWIDGKPLYEITKIFPHDTNWDGARTNISHGIQNIDTCVSVEGYCNANNKYIVKHATRTPNDAYLSSSGVIAPELSIDICGFDDTVFTLILGSVYHSFSIDYNVRVTFRYTKTTDTPGSGTWTPSGVPAHHYSTEEQVIGTWTDGKPLYEKTFQLHSISASGYEDLSIPNLKRAINLYGYVDSGVPVPYVDVGGISGMIGWSIVTNAVRIMTGSRRTITDGYVTIQYTKTTD